MDAPAASIVNLRPNPVIVVIIRASNAPAQIRTSAWLVIKAIIYL